MERLTRTLPGGGYAAESSTDQELLTRLGSLEDLYDALLAERERITAEMERLRGQGKVKTATYQQRIAGRLMVQNLIDRFDIYAK